MAKVLQQKKAQPATEQQADPRQLFDEALAGQQAELAALQRQRAELLREVLTDPAGASERINNVDDQIKIVKIKIEALNAGLEEAEVEARAIRETAAIEASKANRKAGLQCAANSIELAINADACANALVESILALRENGDRCADHFQAALVELHSNTARLHDSLALVTPRAAHTSADCAVAVVHIIQRLMDAIGAPALDQFVMLNGFTPKFPTTLEAATAKDGEMLTERFAK